MKPLPTRATFILLIFTCVAPSAAQGGKPTSSTLKRHPHKYLNATEPDRYCPTKEERGSICPEEKAGEGGCTSLMVAAESGDLKRIRTLLAKGVDVNARSASGHTALMLAAAEGHLDAVKALLAAGADPNARGAAFHFGEFSTLISALNRCNKNWLEIVEAMIAAGAEVNPKGDFSRSPLMYAVEQHDLAMVKALLDRGADVNLKNSTGVTPLMTATISCLSQMEVIKILLDAGADVKAQSNDGETALSLLAVCQDKTRQKEITRLLKGAGAQR